MTRSERRNERLRAALEILAARSEPLHLRDLWRALCERVPVANDELKLTSTGEPRGENDFRWHTIGLVKAGWLHKSSGYWSATEAGRIALEEYPDAESFGRAMDEAYRLWNRTRDSKSDDVPAESLILRPEEPPILDAAASLLQRGLRDGGSAFTDAHKVWSAEVADTLHAAFVEPSDLTPDVGFMEKLKGQIGGCPDDVVLLAAELLTLNLLPLSNLSAASKRTRITEVLSWMSQPVTVPSAIDSAFDHSVFGGGRAFHTYLWKMLQFLVILVRHCRSIAAADLEAALTDPWAWRELMMTAPGPNVPSQREALLYVAHPTVFLPIVNRKHKEAIRTAFAAEIDGLTDDVDRDLLRITLALQADLHEQPDYYRSPLLERWQPADENVKRRAWLVRGASVHGVNLVTPWLTEGWVSLSATSLRELEPGVEKAEVKAAVDEDYSGRPAAVRSEKTVQFHSFLTRMQLGDVVTTTRDGNVYVGLVTGEPEFTDSPQPRLRRTVDWQNADSPLEFADLPQPLPAKFRSQGELLDLTEEVALFEGYLKEGPALVPEPELAFKPASPQLADVLLTDQGWLQEAIDLLWERKQLIFYGPPGTGKTYLATKLAAHLTAPEAVKLVQFHPSYAYEDFFQGYRPVSTEDGKLGYELRPGPFLRLVRAARQDSTTPYVMIIDEINRANLAKVFGELYFLLEYRDESIDLLYSEEEEQFTLPENVFLIGTMNTADRSIAQVDAAMRRRFAFRPLHPSEEPVKGLLARWLQANQLPDEAAQLLAELNTRVRMADFAIGPSYFMRPEVHTDKGLERVWSSSIMPLLEDLHYGDDIDVQAVYGLTALRRSLGAAQQPTVPADLADTEHTAGPDAPSPS